MNRKHDWLRQSAAELHATETLLKAGDHAWACFTAQQSAEKAFKALLCHVGKTMSTHDIVDMLKALMPKLSVSADVVKAGNTLNRYYVSTRYPDSFSSGAPAEKYFEADAKEALTLARLVYEYAAATLGPPGTSAP